MEYAKLLMAVSRYVEEETQIGNKLSIFEYLLIVCYFRFDYAAGL